MKRYHFIFLLIFASIAFSQAPAVNSIPGMVDFGQHLRTWDGFGFNYVESAQTRDYGENPQDYGGFSLLSDTQKQEIAKLVFGKEGLDVDIVKMFLDPWHQHVPGGSFDHQTSTRNMMEFVRLGLEHKAFDVITTLYGPPPWATIQKHIGGRDFDLHQADNLARYMIDWVKYLQAENVPVKYLSIHNEGEDFYRWTYDKGNQRLERFDYNMYWPPEQVNMFINLLATALDSARLNQIGITNGEPSNWTRFYFWGYADALYHHDSVMRNLDLITTHGFLNGNMTKLSFGTANSLTTDLLRSKRPDLHAWVTSMSWGEMGTDFIKMVHENIYAAKVNAVIPWAGINVPDFWIDGDPNLGTTILVSQDGQYELTNGYYFYKQLTTAGHKGMAVANATIANPVSNIIAFSGNNSGHPDAFVVSSKIFIWGNTFRIKIKNSQNTKFRAYRSIEDGSELYRDIGVFEVVDGIIQYEPPVGSTTTFIGIE